VTSKYIHIISFNIPFPADYGGIVDIYYKLRALKEAGVRIILHCFMYGRQPSKELEELCFQVHYYPRKSGVRYLFHITPYIVLTRNSKIMPNYLLEDSFPVLFEGLHTTGLLKRCREARKQTLIRAHNIEHRYYRSLSRAERRLSQKLFLWSESYKLRRYERTMEMADHILGITAPETKYYNQQFGNAHFIPAFHKFDEVAVPEGLGTYLLFHGNLGVAENASILLEYLMPVLSSVTYPVVVAGKDPSRKIIRRLQRHPHIRLVANPLDEELEELIRNAQVNLLLTRQSTGIKLKLLHALYAGRHCLVNPPMVEGTGLAGCCTVAADKMELRSEIERLMTVSLDIGEVAMRKKALLEYSNRAGAEKILRLIS